jgi:beta-xylosidase
MAIGVAVATSPTGPFADAIGAPLITSNMTTFSGQGTWTWDDIDPTIYIDDDAAKTAYLYFGNTYLKYVKLNSDMISVDTSGTSSGLVKDAIVAVATPAVSGLGFTEAPWLCKHNGIYYLSYAAGWEERLYYCTSSSPAGPWEAGGLLMSYSKNCNTSHQAIIDYNGNSYILYHNGTLAGGDSYHRSVCVDSFAYNSDGSISTITPTY